MNEIERMKEFYRVMLGKGSMYAKECRDEGFIFAHFGIEKEFWSGFSSCTSKINFNENTLNNILSTDTFRCDNPQFEILNISLAGWNSLVSLILFTIYISLLYLFKKRKQ